MNQNRSVDFGEIFSKSKGQSTEETIGLQQHTMGEHMPSPLLAAKLHTLVERQKKLIAELQTLATQIAQTQDELTRKINERLIRSIPEKLPCNVLYDIENRFLFVV